MGRIELEHQNQPNQGVRRKRRHEPKGRELNVDQHKDDFDLEDEQLCQLLVKLNGSGADLLAEEGLDRFGE